jgi:hypothetical protein
MIPSLSVVMERPLMRRIWVLIHIGYFSLQFPILVQAHSMKEIGDAFANEGNIGMELLEAQPSARALRVHSPEEAAETRGYAISGLDVPEHPSLKSPLHGSGKGADISELHTTQHESITRAINEQLKGRCIQLYEHQQRLDQKIEVLKKSGKAANFDELQNQSDKVHALIADTCTTPK